MVKKLASGFIFFLPEAKNLRMVGKENEKVEKREKEKEKKLKRIPSKSFINPCIEIKIKMYKYSIKSLEAVCPTMG